MADTTTPVAPTKAPEVKVVAAVLGALLGSTGGTLILWILGVLAWHAPSDAGAANDALAAVPAPVAAAVLAILAAIGSGVLGYSAPRTSDAARGISPSSVHTELVAAEAPPSVIDPRYTVSPPEPDPPAIPTEALALDDEAEASEVGEPADGYDRREPVNP